MAFLLAHSPHPTVSLIILNLSIPRTEQYTVCLSYHTITVSVFARYDEISNTWIFFYLQHEIDGYHF